MSADLLDAQTLPKFIKDEAHIIYKDDKHRIYKIEYRPEYKDFLHYIVELKLNGAWTYVGTAYGESYGDKSNSTLSNHWYLLSTEVQNIITILLRF